MIHTGYVIVTERDTNPYSSTYNQTRTRTYEDTTLCPIGWKMYYRIDGNGYNQGQTVYDYLPCSADGIITQADVNSVLYRDYSYDWNLKHAEMGTCVTTIGDSAFTGRAASTSDNYAIKRRTLTSVVFPSTLTAIGNNSFDYCTALTSITVPDSVTTIGNEAFKECTRLASVTLGSGITSIGSNAFYYSYTLSSLTCKATTPPTLGSGALASTNANLVIYVPSSSLNAYKTATGWSTYASIIQAIPS